MAGHELTIEQTKPPYFQACHKPGQRNFRRVTTTGKHAFAAKCAPNGQTIKTTDENVLTALLIHLPTFDAMGMAELVQPVKRLFDGGVYPRLFAFPFFLRTDSNHFGEGEIGRNPETVSADGFAQRTRHPEIIERNNRPHFWFNPENVRIITGIGHRKYSRRISFH